jgi:hypothetical protein
MIFVDVKDIVLPRSIKAMLATLILDRVCLHNLYQLVINGINNNLTFEIEI